MRAEEATLVVLDSSTSAEDGGPYAADVVFHGPDGCRSESRLVLTCEDAIAHGEEELRLYDNTGHFATVKQHDVAETLTLREVRDRLLAVDQ